MRSLTAARVRVPCSTSNFGSGYDTIGLALDRYLDAAFIPDESGDLSVERSGTLARLAADEPDLVARAFIRRLGRGTQRPSGTIRLSSDIPVARGLGTSAAARIAGFALADAAGGSPEDKDSIFAVAVSGEG
ncbi:MAG: homoserine kinase, partial [Gemmatimonadetes bacterium]|nr:homoserine kinase [Gemmatimonadota bacterium]